MDYRIFPPGEMIDATVTLPLSKSISNRLLVINALCPGAPALGPVADCDDTRVLAAALPVASGRVDVGPAGTAMRFLAAYYAATPGADVILDGDDRMRQRPIGALVSALRSLGADISYAGEEGFPPLRIAGRRLGGGDVSIDAQVSSQFVSALLMVAPVMAAPLRLVLTGEPVSFPYIRMTAALMARYGVEVEFSADAVTVAPGPYSAPAAPVAVEPDWSAASYWYEIAALSAGFVNIAGLAPSSMQGDAAVAAIFEQLGINTDFEAEEGVGSLLPTPDQAPRLNIDMAACPDLVPAVVVTAAMLGIPFAISGLASLRIKECDRADALVTEMRRLGLMLTCENNTLTWELQRHPIAELPVFDTYNDHRMAMALAPISIFVPGIVVRDAEVVAKSYPGFWDDLRAAGFTLADPAAPLPGADGDPDDDVPEGCCGRDFPPSTSSTDPLLP